MSIYFLGNCQTSNISDSSHLQKFNRKNLYCFTTSLTSHSTFFQTKKYLRDFFSENEYKLMVKTGSLGIQPSLADITHKDIKLFVCNLFPENANCYVHKNKNFIIMAVPHLLKQLNPDFIKTLQNDFNQISDNQFDNSYFSRFTIFLETIRKAYPAVPIIVIKRISLFPILSPDPMCWLPCWKFYWQKADLILSNISSNLGNIQVLNLDILLEKNTKGQDNFLYSLPRFRTTFKINNNKLDFRIRANTEYLCQDIWDNAALQIKYFLSEQKPIPKAKAVPAEWYKEKKFISPSLVYTTKLLQSENGMLFEKAISLLFLKYPENHTNLLINNMVHIPVDYNSLKIIETYIHIFPKLSLYPVLDYLENKIKRVFENNDTFINYHTSIIESLRKYITYANNNFDFISPNDKLFFWGAAEKGKQVLKKFKNLNIDSLVTGIIDSNPILKGKELMGKKIINPEQLMTQSSVAILITSLFVTEITEQIKAMKSPNIRIINLPVEFNTLLSLSAVLNTNHCLS